MFDIVCLYAYLNSYKQIMTSINCPNPLNIQAFNIEIYTGIIQIPSTFLVPILGRQVGYEQLAKKNRHRQKQ